MSFITVQNLKYRYPHAAELALKDISFTVEKGEFIGIIGKNAAGKSTLCCALTGLVPQFYKGAYGGRVLIGGAEAAKTPVASLCRRAGLVFQNPFNQLSGAKDTVYEEIAFGLQNLGIPREEMHRRIGEALQLLDIWAFRDRNPFKLSGGQMQRVAIASILVMKPEALILDEPTSQLDPQGSGEVFRAVEALARSGITILMAEQKMERLAGCCDRIMLLDNGNLAAFDTPERIFSMPDIKDYGICPPVVTQFCKQWNIRSENGAFPASLDGLRKLKDRIPGPALSSLSRQGRRQTPDASSSEITFTVQNLDFHYSEAVPVLSGLFLTLDQRPTAIIGQNGAGKTTFVKLLKGLLKPAGGSIFYGREELSGKTAAMLAGRIGYVFQNPDDQIFKYNVLDEVMFGPLNTGMDKETARQRSLEALELTGLAGREEINPYDLELSERKMVSIASVLAMDTDVVIFDEPTIAQDYEGRLTVRRILKLLEQKQKSVISILHDMDFAADCFERIIVMAHGKVLKDGSPQNIFANRQLLQEARLELPQTLKLADYLNQLSGSQ